MFKTIQSLRPLSAPATAGLLLGTLLILEERHFDQNCALLLALLTAVAVAEILPSAALLLVFAGLAGVLSSRLKPGCGKQRPNSHSNKNATGSPENCTMSWHIY
jgi:chromate transport protein ChrA